MNYNILLLALFLSFPACLAACLPDGVNFSTQVSIDQFASQNPGCTSIEGQVIISGNDITNLDGLSNVTSYGDALKIWENPLLKNIQGLSGVSSIGGELSIINNSDLVDLQGLENLLEVGGGLQINTNVQLLHLDALNQLSEVGGFLFINNNRLIEDLEGLANLSSLGEELVVSNNLALLSMEGLEKITLVKGWLRFSNNDQLASLEALKNITSIGGELRIENNPLLSDLKGLEKIESVDGDLWFYNNANLVDLSALQQLKSINGTLTIWQNPVLTSLAGLENIASNSIQNLILMQSTQLSICSVASICDYLQSGGMSTISGNSQGCNSTIQIEATCVSTATDSPVAMSTDLSLFPNPSDGLLQIRGWPATAKAEVKIYNALGQVFLEQNIEASNQIDLTPLKPGTYFLHLKIGTEDLRRAIVRY